MPNQEDHQAPVWPGTLYELFATTARRFGDRTALEAQGEKLSYARLADRVDYLAARMLGAAAPRPPRRIGILADRSVAAYAGYLAAMRLGAAAVPLNPGLSRERLEMIAGLAELDVVLSDEVTSGLAVPEVRVPPSAAGPSGEGPSGEGVKPADLAAVPLPRPDDVAYIVFTSGTTGMPKGVPVLHRNARALIDYLIPHYGVDPDCRLSCAFDLAFDGSVMDIFCAWGTGAALVAASRNDVIRPARFIARERITHWSSVPSLIDYASRLNDLSTDGLPTLRWSHFGGEQLTLGQARLWQSAAPGSIVENMYGATELTVICMAYQLPLDPADWPVTVNGTVPIGTPFPGMETQVLDGELCIRGPQRFPGYLRRDENANRFTHPDGTIHDTCSQPGPDLFYRTGDHVRPLGEGDPNLVYVGRIDHQVKISGHRIELAEVEAALRALPGIAQAVVVTRPGAFGETALEAYYTGHEQDPVELRTSLSILPQYMVPRGFTHLDVLPLSPAGKIDRRALSGLG